MATKDALFLFWASNYPTCYHSGFSHLALTQTMELYKYLSSPFPHLFCLYLYFVKALFFFMLIAVQSPPEVSLPSCAQEEHWLSSKKMTPVKAIHS